MNGVVFQCANCRALTSVNAVSVEGDRAGLACRECRAVTYLPVAGPTSSARVVVDAEAAPRPTATSRGLPPSSALATTTPSSMAPAGDAASFSPEVRERIVGRLAKPNDDNQVTLAMAFDALLDRWGSPAEHKKLLKSASIADQLAFVGQRYRAVLDEVPNDGAAKGAQNEIMALAMASLTAKKDLGNVDTDGGGKGLQVAVAAVLAIAVALVAIWMVPRLLPTGGSGARINQVDP